MKQFSSDLITIKQLYKLFENTEFLLSFKQECLSKRREQRKQINQINSSTPYGRRFQDLFNYKGHKTNPKTLLSALWKASTTFPETRQSLPGQHQKTFFWSRQRLQEHWEIVTTIIKYSWDRLEVLTNTFQNLWEQVTMFTLEETCGNRFDSPVTRKTGLFPNTVFCEVWCPCKLHMTFPACACFMESIKNGNPKFFQSQQTGDAVLK